MRNGGHEDIKVHYYNNEMEDNQPFVIYAVCQQRVLKHSLQ